MRSDDGRDGDPAWTGSHEADTIGGVFRSVASVALLALSAVASLVWLGWQVTSVAAGGGGVSRSEAEPGILAGLVILVGWVVAWRLFRRSGEA